MKKLTTIIVTTLSLNGTMQLTPVASAQPIDEAIYYHTGTTGSWLGHDVAAAGDYNDDGVVDYVIGAPVTDLLRGAVEVYSGVDGELLRRWTGLSPYDAFGWSVACAGDVNNDGEDDVIVGSPFCENEASGGGAVTVLSGRNGGVLHRIEGTAQGGVLGWSVAGAGDVNGDGHADFIVGAMSEDGFGGSNAGAVRVYSGATGAVLFGTAGTLSNANLGSCVASVGDVNDDGFPDVAVGAYGASRAYVYDAHNHTLIRMLTNNVAGSHFGFSLANAGDVTLDGVPDLLVGAPEAIGGGRAYLYDGADGTLVNTFSGEGSSCGFAVDGGVDVSGDDIPDLAIGSNGRVEIRSGLDGALLRTMYGGTVNFGTGVALLPSIGAPSLGPALVVGDLGADDQFGAAYVFVIEPNGLGLEYAQTWSAGPAPGHIAAADLNRDGRTDLVTVSPSMDKFSILFRNASGMYTPGGTYSSGDGPVAVAAADFDRDGDNDLAVAATNENRVIFYRNSGTGFMVRVGDIKVGRRPSFLVAEDVNGDNYIDIVTTNKADDTVTVLLHNKHISPPLHQQFLFKKNFLVGDAPIHLATGHFNADSRTDLIVANEAGNSLTVLLSTAPGVFNSRKDTPTDAKPACLAVSDFNDDGFTDVAYICRGVNKAQVRQGKNNGTFNPVQRTNVGGSPRAIVALDMEYDGSVDLVTCNFADNTVTVLLNNSIGQFSNSMTYGAGPDPVWMVGADVDNDQDDDIITVTKTSPSATILLNLWF